MPAKDDLYQPALSLTPVLDLKTVNTTLEDFQQQASFGIPQASLHVS
jgi:hypothetical protein